MDKWILQMVISKNNDVPLIITKFDTKNHTPGISGCCMGLLLSSRQ